MSLETEIQKLTAAVQALTAAMESAQRQPVEMPTMGEVNDTAPPSPKVEPEAAKEAEQAPANDAAPMAKDALQSWCIEQVRADKGFKAKLVATLAEYDAKTINALPDDKVAEVYSKLGGK